MRHKCSHYPHMLNYFSICHKFQSETAVKWDMSAFDNCFLYYI